MIPNEPAVLANSLWTATANPAPDTPPLAGAEGADVAIVGSGIRHAADPVKAAEELARLARQDMKEQEQ